MSNSITTPIDRANYSSMRLNELGKRLGTLKELQEFPSLTIFAAGSYARLEASKFSDIDMFFLTTGSIDEISDPRTNSLRLFGKVIDTIDTIEFPKFSNDCEYLVLLPTTQILDKLGSRIDDHENYFTARMLLLLESHCLYGQQVYDDITKKIVESYFKDYPDHKYTFQPLFLLNDICRFWKTLLLNYENKRSLPPGTENIEEKRRKQKVRNFKLKYSRMTTCFASIAALGSHHAPVSIEQVLTLTTLTPRKRLESIPLLIPSVQSAVDDVLDKYSWFLEMTGQPTDILEEHFSDKQRRTEMFQKAGEYGDAMYNLLKVIDESDARLRLLRYLVI